MTQSHLTTHWGQWVLVRARIVGFRLQKELAAAVGCTEDQLSRWVNMSEPPVGMRKGFDKKLAYALQTTQSMLFSEWRTVPPEQPDRLLFHPDQLELEDAKFFPWVPEEEYLLRKVLRWLQPAELQWALRQVTQKVLEANDKRAPVFRQILDRYRILDHYTATGERLPVASPKSDSKTAETPPAADSPVDSLSSEIAEIRRRVEQLQARSRDLSSSLPPGWWATHDQASAHPGDHPKKPTVAGSHQATARPGDRPHKSTPTPAAGPATSHQASAHPGPRTARKGRSKKH